MGDFDANVILKNGWGQGSVFGEELRENYCPGWDIVVVISHDCDVAHHKLEGEPKVEVICGQRIQSLDKIKTQGRHPRELHLETLGAEFALSIHDRDFLPREILIDSCPAGQLESKERRILTEWLAKRYIRSAFPNNFDRRWRIERKKWEKLMKSSSQIVQSVYLRLSTMDELEDDAPYKVEVLLAVTDDGAKDLDARHDLESNVLEFWNERSGVECVEARTLGLDEITLKDMMNYQRFDLDWISFEDDTESSPVVF